MKQETKARAGCKAHPGRLLSMEHAMENISNAKELSQMVDGGSYTLTCDIVVNSSFASLNLGEITLDGAGHTICSLTKPLFGILSASDIKNLNLKGDITAAKNTSVGLLAAETHAGTVEYVSTYGSVYNPTPDAYSITVGTGGLVGYAANTAFTSVANHARVTGSLAGGIAGVGLEANFVLSQNTGAITANIGGANNIAGGIVGYEFAPYQTPAIITNNANAGYISALYSTNQTIAGGIAGVVMYAASLSDNRNYADISATASGTPAGAENGSSAFAGGIVGEALSYLPELEITYNSSGGTVFADSRIGYISGAGGIAGVLMNVYGTPLYVVGNTACNLAVVSLSREANLDLVGRVVGYETDPYSADEIYDNYGRADTYLTGLSQGGFNYSHQTVEDGDDEPDGTNGASCESCMACFDAEAACKEFGSCYTYDERTGSCGCAFPPEPSCESCGDEPCPPGPPSSSCCCEAKRCCKRRTRSWYRSCRC